MSAFYFIVITTSTVGYGDISPTSIPGRVVVIVLIMIAISILPGLIGDTVSEARMPYTRTFLSLTHRRLRHSN